MAAGNAFGPDQQVRLRDAVEAAERHTGMHFPVYVGSLHDDPDRFAEEELARLAFLGPQRVLVVVDPQARIVHIATSAAAGERLDNRGCALAVLSMTTSFGLGDLVGGLVVGLRMLADATAPAHPDHGRPASTSSTVTTGI